MAGHTEIEATETVTRQTVTTTLKNHGVRVVEFHDARDDRFEDGLVRGVVDSVTEREVDGVVLALADTNVTKLTGSREILAILVERDRHDSVGGIEGLLDTITVVNIDIDVEDALVEAQELEDTENDIY